MSLTRDQIRAAKDRVPVKVPIPEWDGDVHVRALNGPEIFEWQRISEKAENEQRWTDTKAILAVFATCDESGARIFDESDLEWLIAEKSFGPINRIYEAASRLNVLSAKALKSLEKNSDEAPASSSGEGSPTDEDGA
jgi:hypothetical protein